MDFSSQTPLHACTVCNKGHVYANETTYQCDQSAGEEKTCGFRMSRTILQREIPPEQVVKLLETGKTDLLTKFVSKKGRPFLRLPEIGKDRQSGFRV